MLLHLSESLLVQQGCYTNDLTLEFHILINVSDTFIYKHGLVLGWFNMYVKRGRVIINSFA